MLFSSIGRAIRAIISVLSLGFIKFAEPIERRPEVTGAEYDEVIREKAEAAKQLKDAIGGIMAQQEMCGEKLKDITGEIEQLEQEKAGAQHLAEEKVKKLRAKGLTNEQILDDSEIKEWQAAFNDAATTLEEKRKRAADLEESYKNLTAQIDGFVIQGQQLAREVEKLRSEKWETIAAMAAAQQLEKSTEALAGISTSGTDEKLRELRLRRAEAEGRGKAATRLAGTDISAQRENLRTAARRHVENKEFLEGLGLAVSAASEAKPGAEQPSKEKTGKLPV